MKLLLLLLLLLVVMMMMMMMMMTSGGGGGVPARRPVARGPLPRHRTRRAPHAATGE
jgi:hypothetical protein